MLGKVRWTAIKAQIKWAVLYFRPFFLRVIISKKGAAWIVRLPAHARTHVRGFTAPV